MNAPFRPALSGTVVACSPGGGKPGPLLVDWRHDTLVDLMTRRGTDAPEAVLYTYLEDGETREISLDAAGLDAAARRIGRALAKLGKPGERVVLLFDDGLDTIVGLFGCLAAGLVAVSGIHPAAPRSAERLTGILRDCGASLVLGQARVLAEFQQTLGEALDEFDLRWVASDKIKAIPGESWTLRAGRNTDLALIQYTSGSSRAPRGVMLSHRNILHNLHGQAAAFGYRAGDTGVSWLPFSHDMGLIGCVLMAIYGGGRCILLSPSHFLEDPLRWPRAIARYAATLSGGPNFAYDLCARRAEGQDLAGLDLSSWAVAVNGAEPIRAEVMRRFAAAFAPAGFRPEALRPSYGMAEATLLVTCGTRLEPTLSRRFDRAALHQDRAVPVEAAAVSAVELVGCGRGLPDQSLAIVDPHLAEGIGRPLEDGRVGEIWIAGPSIAQGYFARAEDNAAYFAGDLGDGRGPYLRSGDLGFVFAGEVFVTGRLRDLLVIRGKNYYPQDFEHSAEASHDAVRPGCAACVLAEETGDLVVVAELVAGRREEAAAVVTAIRAAIVRDHGIAPQRIVLVPGGAVPKTPSGKIRRAQTRDALAEGQIGILHEWAAEAAPPPPVAARPAGPIDPADLEMWFATRMRQMGIDLHGLDPDLRLAEVGFDSLKIVELKADLEKDFGISVQVADLYEFQDIRSLTAHVRRAVLARNTSGPAAPPQPAPVTEAPLGGGKPVPARNRLAEQRRRRAASTA